MQAVILVGGEGTRLRPLTSNVPKPVVTLVDRPFIAFMFEWLKAHGVDDVIMSCGFKASVMRDVLGDGSAFGIRLRFVEEPDPRGTGGALKYAEDLLDERFLMLNGDVLTDLDLTAQIEQHERTGAVGTLGLVGVEDPSAYGLVRLEGDNAVREFVEKPSADQIDTNMISAGAYVLERSILDLMPPDQNVSIEREVWPRLVANGLYAFPHQAYWMDIGTPDRYLQGTFDIIEGTVRTEPVQRLGAAQIADDARVGSLVVLGDGARVGARSTVDRAVILDGAQIGEDCFVHDAIIGPGARIGDRTHVTGRAVVGEGVTIGSDNVVTNGARVFSGVEIPDGGLKF